MIPSHCLVSVPKVSEPSHCLISVPKVGTPSHCLILFPTVGTPSHCLISFCYRLKLNNDKTEALVAGSRRRVSVSQDSHLRVGSHISFKSHVKSLGVYIDATLSMAKLTDHINRSAYLEIKRISSVRHLLTGKATVQPMCSFVLIGLDYCNSFLIDITLSKCNALKKKKKNQNHAAKVVFRKSKHEHVTHFSKSFTGFQSKEDTFQDSHLSLSFL